MCINELLANHRNRVRVGLALVFAAMYSQAPLYSSNQNTYLLHGLADGGFGSLSRDWMANTIDPFPVFSALVSTTYSYFHPYFFYGYYVFLLILFSYSLMGIGAKIWRVDRSFSTFLVYALSLTAFASPIFSKFTSIVIGVPISQFLFSGLAHQYLLGPVFQPSVFGSLLIVSVYLFLRNRPFLAVSLLGVTINIHANYLITAASLTLAYMIILYREGRWGTKPLYIGAYSFLLATPVLAYTIFEFGPTSAQTMNEAHRILVDYRFPHHAKVEVWFGTEAVLQVAMLGFALWLHRKSRIFLIFCTPFVVGGLLTLLQIVTDSYFLALLFPWRVSAFLVPLATAMIIARLTHFLFFDSNLKNMKSYVFFNRVLVSCAVVAFFVGSFVSYLRLASGPNDYFSVLIDAGKSGEQEMLIDHVVSNAENIDVYIVPASWEDFRIDTGTPILIDHKTHPYKDEEIVEWYERRQLIENIYRNTGDACINIQWAVTEYGVTKIIKERDQNRFDCSFLSISFQNDRYVEYEIVSDSL